MHSREFVYDFCFVSCKTSQNVAKRIYLHDVNSKFHVNRHYRCEALCTYQCQAGGGGGGARGGILIDRFGPGLGHLNFLAVPGVGISEFLFMPVTTNHFLGWEI